METWRRLALRLIGPAALATAVALVPLPAGLPGVLGDLAMPVAVVVAVCWLGKVLYDTLFYDHYRP